MWVVVQEVNFNDLELLPALAAEIGFARLTLSLDIGDWGQDTWTERNSEADVHRRFNTKLAEKLISEGERLGVEVTFWIAADKYDVSDSKKLCPWPFERSYISSDMRVVPCCMIGNPDVSDLGNARDFIGEWNGAAMAEFRRQHISGEIPSFCRSCYKTA